MGWRTPGPLGLMDIGAALDTGTVGRQRAIPPGPMSGGGNAYYVFAGPVLVGKPPRDPGKNEDGSVYEDMLNNDSPVQAASIKNDPVFKLPDAKLEELGKDLMDSVSTTGGVLQPYDLNTVALECWDRFCKGTGGTYTNATLTKAVNDNDATREFVRDNLPKICKAIDECKCDLSKLVPYQIGRYAFNSTTDKMTGLGIIIHDIWSIKAEIKDFTGTWDTPSQTGAYSGKVVFTLTDDFGLDWNDIVQHGNDHKPPTAGFYNTGDRFKAWYILQHFRPKAKPFFVEVKVEIDFEDLDRNQW